MYITRLYNFFLVILIIDRQKNNFGNESIDLKNMQVAVNKFILVVVVVVVEVVVVVVVVITTQYRSRSSVIVLY